MVLGLVLWVVALNGGTLAINSAFDRDEGDVAYLRRPPSPPPGLFAFGLGLMVAGLGVSLLLPRPYTWLYLTCFIMSVLYSVPPARLKAVAGADWIINLLGFGTLTPLAGWASTGEPLTVWGWFLVWGFGALFAGLYPLTQLYQFDEDERRGDRTFALLLGKRRSMGVAIACVTRRVRAVHRGGPGGGMDRCRSGPMGGAGGGVPRLARRAAPLVPAGERLGAGATPAGYVPRARRVGRDGRRGPFRVGVSGVAFGKRTPIFHGVGMSSAVELERDIDRTDVPYVVRGAVKIGLITAIAVLLYSLVSRFTNGVVESALKVFIVAAGTWLVTFLPGSGRGPARSRASPALRASAWLAPWSTCSST